MRERERDRETELSPAFIPHVPSVAEAGLEPGVSHHHGFAVCFGWKPDLGDRVSIKTRCFTEECRCPNWWLTPYAK